MAEYEKGKIVTGSVTGIEDYGIFLGLDDYYSGLIHISEISKNFVRSVKDYVNVGETIKAKVIDVDDDTFHVKLSIKDIDYRISKKKKVKIVETKNGFLLLRSNLDIWVKEKLEEIGNEQ